MFKLGETALGESAFDESEFSKLTLIESAVQIQEVHVVDFFASRPTYAGSRVLKHGQLHNLTMRVEANLPGISDACTISFTAKYSKKMFELENEGQGHDV